jgi:hypothetical protein
MRIHDPIAIARNLAVFDFHELAPFNGGAFCMYYRDQGDQSDWELHPDTDELLMVLEGSITVERRERPTACPSPSRKGVGVDVPQTRATCDGSGA